MSNTISTLSKSTVKKYLPALLIGLSLIASSRATLAEEAYESIYLYPSIGMQFFDGKRNVDDAFTWSAAVGYKLSEKWSTEFAYGQSNTEADTGGVDVDMDFYRLDGLFHYPTESEWKPFALAGLGHGDFNNQSGGTDHETRFNFGGGVMKALTNQLSLRGDARLIYGFDDDTVDSLLMVGVTYALTAAKAINQDRDGDGVFDEQDQCPYTATGTKVDATGCPLDSDGDDVSDSMDSCPNTPAGAPVDGSGCALDSDKDGVADYMDDCPDTPQGAKVDEKGCRIILKETVSVRLNVNFDTNSSEIKPDFVSEIQKVADFMRQYPDTRVVIEGHSDDRGNAGYNQKLSQRRAAAVADFLGNNFGIDVSRIRSVGYGEERPIADNNTAEGRAQNRRVIAVIQTVIEK